MIFDPFIILVKSLILLLLDGFEAVTLPFQLVSVLSTITGYGAYIVGSDILLIIAGVITFWWSVKSTLGLVLFIWRLLPFT